MTLTSAKCRGVGGSVTVHNVGDVSAPTCRVKRSQDMNTKQTRDAVLSAWLKNTAIYLAGPFSKYSFQTSITSGRAGAISELERPSTLIYSPLSFLGRRDACVRLDTFEQGPKSSVVTSMRRMSQCVHIKLRLNSSGSNRSTLAKAPPSDGSVED